MGATSGIGEHVAESLAATGWRVGVAGRKVDRMKALKEMFPDSIEWEAIDITKSEAPRKLLSLIRKIGGMDIYFEARYTAGSGHGRDQCGRIYPNGRHRVPLFP